MVQSHPLFTHFATAATNSNYSYLGNTTITFGIPEIIGLLLMMVLTGIRGVAGLGGGGPNVVILIHLFGLVPKQATITVFACIFGSVVGTMINQMQRQIDDKPVINYRFASLTIPLVFIGAIGGVMLNQFLPSIATVAIIIGVNIYKLPGMMTRFRK